MRNKRLWAMALAASLIATSLVGCEKTGKNTLSPEAQESVKEMDEMADAFDRAGILSHSDTSGKEETVYVIMDANGANSETIVSEWLKNPDGADNMVDITALSDIEVVKGNATYTQDADGQMQWNAKGGDVYYQGRTDKELPVEVKVSYELDGQPVDAEALKDVSGHVKIKYDYENKVSKVMQIGDETVSIYQPFTMITGILLDDEKVSNITVTDGKVINTGSYTAVFGVAMPGLSESIGLDKLKEEKDTDIEIPDSVAIEADVTDFTMPMSMTMATNDAISTLKLDENGDKIDELKEKSDELSDGMDELIDGSKKLDDGGHDLKDGTDELTDGVNKLDDGAGDLQDGAHKLLDGTVELKDGAWRLYDGTNTLHEGTVALRDGVSKLNGKTPELADGVKALKDGTDSLNDGIKKVTDNNEKLTSGAAQVAGGIKQLNDSVNSDEAKAKLATLKGGSAQVRSGISDAADGAGSLVEGLGGVKAGAEDLTSGIAGIETKLKTEHVISDDLDDLDDLLTALTVLCQSGGLNSDEINQVKAAMLCVGIVEQSGDLYNGASQLTNYLSQIETGAGELKEGLDTLNGSYPQIDDGIGQVVDNMGAIAAGVGQLNAGAAALASGVTDYTNGVSQISGGAKQLQEGTNKLNGKIPELVQGVSDLNNGAMQLESGACTLNNGAGDLFDGVGKLKDGAFDLANGTDDLKDGTFKLRNGATELSDGVIQLVDGTGKLKDGVIKLNDEGISKITDLIGNDIENYYDRIEAVKDFSKEYTTFSGSCANTDGTVKFIYKIDSVD